MENKIWVTYGDKIDEMVQTLLEAAQLAQRIPQGARIGLKPNLVVARPADTGATTHPELAGALIAYLQAHGHKDLLILEGSWVGDNTKTAFRLCGYEALSKRYGVPLFDTKTDKTVKKVYDGMEIALCKTACELDYLINLPVLKGHCQTKVTGALKNLKGCISDAEKRRFHTRGLHRPIAYLNKLLKTSFILGDGICGDLDFEEGGNPVRMNRIFCGEDPVLIDSYIAACMGYAPEKIEYIRLAASLGVGSMDLEQAELIELRHDETLAQPAASGKVQRLARYAAPKDACSACYANLIQAFARLQEDGTLRAFEANHICIGQGYRGCAGEIGVGTCTAGCAHSLAGCPPTTSQMLEFLRKQALS